MINRFLFSLCFAFYFFPLFSQSTFPVNGVQDIQENIYAFTNATIVVSPEKTITNGNLIIKNGEIIDVGVGIEIPKNAVTVDLSGKYIYPSFIDLDADYGVTKNEQLKTGSYPQLENARQNATNWNQAINPEFQAIENLQTDTSKNKQWRNAGFGSVLTHLHDGIARGTGAYILLGDERTNEIVIIAKASAHYSFKKGSSTQDYPSSEMGVIALLRQTFYDEKWYATTGNKEQLNLSLLAISDSKNLPQIIEAQDKLQILRADKIGDEFAMQFIIKCGTDAYQRMEEIKKTNAPLILSLNYPGTPAIEDPLDAQLIPLQTLKHWELAPANASFLSNAGIEFCFTSSGLTNKNDYLKNIRKAIQYGLNKSTALAAMTTIPAKLIHASDKIGTLEKGKIANFIITSNNLFESDCILYQNWVNGKPYYLQELKKDIRGVYQLKTGNMIYGLLISGKETNPEFKIIKNTDTIKATGNYAQEKLMIQFKDDANQFQLTGWFHDNKLNHISGRGTQNETWIQWEAKFANVYAEKIEPEKKDSIQFGKIIFPFTEYGYLNAPIQNNILFTNVTVWTNEKEGILNGYDVLIGNGKIVQVGKNISAKNANVVDGTGKHLTAGIIDEHSHIATSSGVNEGTQSVSSEVRIGDIISSEDLNIYRQLAGGVTTSHILHGSANTIGGQTQLIKLRWGKSPEQLKFSGADPFIKFALGENVKQSNWGEASVIRFPQTRMGVEQILDDAFTRAQAYQALINTNKLTHTDLELEALAEILMKKRFITCHSYVQSEINMLLELSDKYNFTVNTFTHILEGYKVADKMKAHGVGASSFSDWWAYKYEVYDAIPQNTAILTRVGVITAVNSDNAEMARRLNQEAAKAIKYAGLSEEEAWKLCTLNPAKLLHVDAYVGSIKVGKDADIVLWSENPLSIYAKPLQTYVDGICYFDIQEDEKMRIWIATERNRIIQKIIAAKIAGEVTIPFVIEYEKESNCEDVFDYIFGNN